MMDVKVQHEDPNLEKEVNKLKNVDHSSALLAKIKSEVLNTVNEYLGPSLDDALYKVLQKHNADLVNEHSVPADVVEKLKQQYKPQKSVEDICKIKMDEMNIQEKDKNKAKNDKTEHENEKSVKKQSKSKKSTEKSTPTKSKSTPRS
ncbi:hypothetical protein Tco_1498831 [Tanacetum coccineum]